MSVLFIQMSIPWFQCVQITDFMSWVRWESRRLWFFL